MLLWLTVMIAHVFACDYDGTVADNGRMAPSTIATLERVRESGRKLLLVTGRMLPDLREICPDADRLFEVIVAENGSVLYFPGRREVRRLGDAPEPALVEALRAHGVPFSVGDSILATGAPYATPALAAIRETGVERTLVFNKGSLMLVPGGVTKGTGLEAALAALELSPHNTVAIGDAENDHAFLSASEFAVAVADAVPALRDRADYVTRAPGPAGVVEFVDEHLLNDLVALDDALARHAIDLGETADGATVAIPAHRTTLLVVGPSSTGKSTVTGVLMERLVAAHRSVCLIDPEGDFRSFAALEGVVVLGGQAEHALPTADELVQLLRRSKGSLVLNLSAMSRREKVDYGTTVLGAVSAMRTTTGMPHWLIIDEAHHLFPAEGSSAVTALRKDADSHAFITLSSADLAREIRTLPTVIAATDLDAFADAARAVLGEGAEPLRVDGGPLTRGELVVGWLTPSPRVVRCQVAQRRLEHQRHVRKYVEGELPPDRSFYFRGPEGKLNLRAANLRRFCELAEGVDEATWAHHLAAGEYSRWVREMIKDPELAREIAALEADATLSPSEARARVLAAVRRRYAV